MSPRNLLPIGLFLVGCYDNTSQTRALSQSITGVSCLIGAGNWCYNNGISGGVSDMLYTCPGRDLEPTKELYCSRGCKIMPSGTDDVCNPPKFKLPLPPGYKWKVNTEARTGKSGDCYPMSDCTDNFHVGKFAIDFGRHVQNYSNICSSNGIGCEIDILAAADGKVTEATPSGSGCFQAPAPYTSGGKVCLVYLDHGGGYKTQYLHFDNDSIVVKTGDNVIRGQVLGKMGSTGLSSGAHLHFQVFHNGSSSTSNSALSGLALEGLDFIDDYKFGDYSKSTNGFTYTSSPDNPHTCSTEPVNGSPCTRETTFSLGQQVWSNLRLTDLSRDICFKVEFYLGDTKKDESSEWCSDRIESDGGWANAFLWASFAPQETGTNWNSRYFVRIKNGGASYLPDPAGMAVTPNFTVVNASAIPSTPTLISPISVPAFPPTAEVSASPILLLWTDSLRVDYYHIIFYIWTGSWNLVGSWNHITSNPVNVIGVQPNTYCAWEVIACNTIGCSNWSNVGYFKTLP